MRPKIGYSILDLKRFSREKIPFEAYELRGSTINPNIKTILNLTEKLEGLDLSLHSQLNRIFSCKKYGYDYFSKSELDILKYEIVISKIIGIKRINFHMTDIPLDKKEIEEFKKIIEFSKKEGVELIYENHVCSAESILNIVNNFQELKICLDFGHLNLAISYGIFKMDINNFIKKINKKVIHVHAHNNYGKKDEHNSLEKGNFNWRNVLINLTNVEKIILEVREIDEALKNKDILEKFYNQKSAKTKF